MIRQPRARGFWTAGALIGALVLIAAVGLCTFESGHETEHHAGSLHVCLTMLVTGLAPMALTTLFVTGHAVTLVLPRVAALSLGVPVPPPKFAVSR